MKNGNEPEIAWILKATTQLKTWWDLLGFHDTWQKKGRAVTDGRYYQETLQLNTMSNIKY